MPSHSLDDNSVTQPRVTKSKCEIEAVAYIAQATDAENINPFFKVKFL